MRFFIIRHGITDWNMQSRVQGREDVPLNEKGLLQAKYCADTLEGIPFDCVISSPLSRARNTAEKIAHGPVICMDEFLERDFGKASGHTKAENDELEKQYGREFLNMESREAVFSRAMSGLDSLRKKYPGKDVVIVTHGGVIVALLRNLLRDPMVGLFIENVGITCIFEENGEYTVGPVSLSPEEFAAWYRQNGKAAAIPEIEK